MDMFKEEFNVDQALRFLYMENLALKSKVGHLNALFIEVFRGRGMAQSTIDRMFIGKESEFLTKLIDADQHLTDEFKKYLKADFEATKKKRFSA